MSVREQKLEHQIHSFILPSVTETCDIAFTIESNMGSSYCIAVECTLRKQKLMKLWVRFPPGAGNVLVLLFFPALVCNTSIDSPNSGLKQVKLN